MSTDSQLNSSAGRVQKTLRDRGYDFRVVELPDSTRTAAEAALAIGCTVAQIAKSLVFRATNSGDPVLVIASGANRVDEKKIGALLGEPIKKPDAAYVREATGYAIGGVPPVLDTPGVRTFIDEDLLVFEEIWAAAGTPHAVFALNPAALPSLTGGLVVAVKQ